MRISGSKFQDHHWEDVRKLLGELSLPILGNISGIEKLLHEDQEFGHARLGGYVKSMLDALAPMYQRARGRRQGNAEGDTVASLCVELVLSLERVGVGRHFFAFLDALRRAHAEHGAFWSTDKRDPFLRNMVNHMFSELRDVVDRENYVVATGRDPPYDYMRICRTIERAYREVERIFSEGTDFALIGVILGRKVTTTPIETRMLKSKRACRPEWLVNWSAAVQGPLHTQAHWIEPYRHDLRKIRAILEEMADGEEMPADENIEALAGDAEAEGEDGWLDDLAHASPAVPEGEVSAAPCNDESGMTRTQAVSRCLAPLAEPVRLAIYLDKLKGMDDAIFPGELFDAETGKLKTMSRLAKMAGVSEPTFRKVRERAFADFMECIKTSMPRLARR